MYVRSPVFRRQPSSVILLSLSLFALLQPICAPAWSQQDNQSARTFAKPNLAGSNPFTVSELEDLELPVALSGFSAVVLHDQQQWRMGSPTLQLVFDGQIYWFTSARELEMFAAAPLEYAPALGGDCIVTFAETGERVQGQLQHGLQHGGRIYLFHNDVTLRQFNENPTQYANDDLALDGNCIVSKFEDGRDVQGLPETTAMVNGLRYQFLGDYQRRQFAANMEHYGIQRRLLIPTKGAPMRKLPTTDKNQKTAKKETKKQIPGEESLQPTSMMDGYCPVTFFTRGVWVRGSFQFKVEYEGKMYLTASANDKEQFEAEPTSYLPVLGGDCLVTKVDTGTNVPGSVHYAAYDKDQGRLYLFAGLEQRDTFNANRQKYENSAALKQQPAEGSDGNGRSPGRERRSVGRRCTSQQERHSEIRQRRMLHPHRCQRYVGVGFTELDAAALAFRQMHFHLPGQFQVGHRLHAGKMIAILSGVGEALGASDAAKLRFLVHHKATNGNGTDSKQHQAESSRASQLAETLTTIGLVELTDHLGNLTLAGVPLVLSGVIELWIVGCHCRIAEASRTWGEPD